MEKIIERINKLLLLSKNNQNEAEAMSALVKAQTLMVKYNIEERDCGMETHRTAEEESTEIVAKAQWEEWLFAIVCKNFRCQGYYREKVPVFIGLNMDVSIAISVYRYAHQFAERGADRLYRTMKKKNGTGRGVRTSYLKGFVIGLKKQFEENAKNELKDQALILMVPTEVTDYYDELCQELRLRKFRDTKATSRTAYEKGYQDGKKIPTIHTALEGKTPS